MYKVDLNCDIGESFGQYTLGHDEEIMKHISSANIACGFHAGDPSTMNKTVKLALENGVSIGAHPGLPDLQGFGRRVMAISPREAYELVLYQVGALNAFVTAKGGKLRHVKPHGALYNMAAVDEKLAEAIAEAVYQLDHEIILYGLAGSELIKAGEKIGLHTANEVFADRTYQNDGTLTSRQNPNALITNVDAAIFQVVRMVKEKRVSSVEGIDFSIRADTICIHGDGPNALDFAKKINEAFAKENISILAR
ncbi:LamB/YcsF family protein [Lederbergia citrea]|uniref:5-oxoprolinase subunit A n=1 Tax=Lederbergia citrea TaxID=2833581 RepID=A0A942Z620_9BACI|nr:5-oxoprolinase subunit PxpA [Lederbergia citrea]MBS4178958.1 LamB/YcsF family protein [Lederbergia citrea]MBS4205639.1 LamB/YcsF family protein [Lederbergia citrea]MBS4224025.1 LamB/YcsF family protein [Lederbergia citrea]